MAGVSDIRAGSAYVEIGTKDSDLDAGLDRAAAKLQRFGLSVGKVGLAIGAAGTALFAPMFAASKAYADQGEELNKRSKITGVAVEQLSLLSYAAKRSSVDLDTLDGGISKMGKTLTQAAEGSKEANESLRSLGLSVVSLNNLTPEQRMKAIADALNKITDPSIRAGKAIEIFGKSGANLLPLLTLGSTGIDKLMNRGKALGQQWKSEDTKAAVEFGDALGDLDDVSGRLATRIGSAVAPVMKILADRSIASAVALGNLIGKHRTLFQVVAVAAGGLVLLGGAIVGIGTAFTVGGVAVGYLAAGLGVVGTLIGAIVSPVGLTVLAIAELTAAFFTLTDTGQQIAKELGRVWKIIVADAKAAFGGIKDALSAGDFKLAAKILWTTMKLEFNRGLNGIWLPLVTGFYEVKSAVTSAWNDTVDDLKTAWSYAKEYLTSWDGVKAGAQEFINWLINAWDAMTSYLGRQLATSLVTSQADTDVRSKYEGKTIGEAEIKDMAVDQVSGHTESAIKEKSDAKVKAENPNLNKSDLQDAQIAASSKAVKDETDRIAAELRKRYLGAKLTEADITRMVKAETQNRIDYMNDMNAKAGKQRRDDYNAAQKKIDDDFAAKHPDEKRKGDEERAKIEAARAQQRLAATKALADALAKIDPTRQAEIDRLEAELAALIAQAKKEKDAAKSDDAPDPNKPNLEQAAEAGKTKISGVFQAQNQSLVHEIFGDPNNDATKETAKNTRQMIILLRQLVSKKHPPFGGIHTT